MFSGISAMVQALADFGRSLAELFKQYEALDGNCFVHNCVDELNNLPVKND